MDLLALDFPVQLSNRAVPKVIENPIKELDFTIKKEVQSLMVICYHVSQVKGVTMAALYTLIHLIDYELNFNVLKTIPSYARSIKYTDGQVVFYNIGTINSKRVQALFDKLLLELPDIIMRISDEELDSMKKMQAEHFKNTSGHVDFHWEAIVEGTYNFNLVEETAAAFRNLTKHMLVNVLKTYLWEESALCKKMTFRFNQETI
uniref:Condensation domain-containing protein n=1 Tax=Romanomermis culicivorax TaxID=13658 RepID=A0A915HXU1_ROMCU